MDRKEHQISTIQSYVIVRGLSKLWSNPKKIVFASLKSHDVGETETGDHLQHPVKFITTKFSATDGPDNEGKNRPNSSKDKM